MQYYLHVWMSWSWVIIKISLILYFGASYTVFIILSNVSSIKNSMNITFFLKNWFLGNIRMISVVILVSANIFITIE
jgi:hypothetical protein